MQSYFFSNTIFRLIAPAVYGTVVYLLILLVNNNVLQINDLFVTQELYVCILLTYVSFESLRIGIIIFDRISIQRSSVLRISLQLVATTSVSVCIVIALLSLYFNLVVGFSISTAQIIMFSVVFSVTAVLYNILYLSHVYLHKENTLRINAERDQRTVLETEILEYRNDINPDLLFESLENLIGIMYKDVEKAEDYIDCLATAYRYVLTNRSYELVPVGDELAAAGNILKLINERSPGLLVLESLLKEKDIDGMLIPGSLPVIMEYIARNSIIASGETFRIALYAEEDYLIIETYLNDRLTLHQPSELAFQRLQRSYSLYTELPVVKVKAYQQNYIKLPVIRVGEETAIT